VNLVARAGFAALGFAHQPPDMSAEHVDFRRRILFPTKSLNIARLQGEKLGVLGKHFEAQWHEKRRQEPSREQTDFEAHDGVNVRQEIGYRSHRGTHVKMVFRANPIFYFGDRGQNEAIEMRHDAARGGKDTRDHSRWSRFADVFGHDPIARARYMRGDFDAAGFGTKKSAVQKLRMRHVERIFERRMHCRIRLNPPAHGRVLGPQVWKSVRFRFGLFIGRRINPDEPVGFGCRIIQGMMRLLNGTTNEGRDELTRALAIESPAMVGALQLLFDDFANRQRYVTMRTPVEQCAGFSIAIAKQHERHAEQRPGDGGFSQFSRIGDDEPVTGNFGDGRAYLGSRWCEQPFRGNELYVVFARFVIRFGSHRGKGSVFWCVWQARKS